MIVACATDRRYVPLAGVMLASLAARGGMPGMPVVVFGWSLSPGDRKRLRRCYATGPLHFVDIDACVSGRLCDLPIKRVNFSVAGYLRLLMPELLAELPGLPKGVRGRLLYLDCDLIVNGSLRPLQVLPLDGRVLAAVAEGEACQRLYNTALGVPADTPYLNSGVLLVDLAAWRRRAMTERTLAFARDNPHRGLFHDQDALNAVLLGDWLPLDRAWNFFEPEATPAPLEAYLAASVIHFAGHCKPTSRECRHPARRLFLRYRRLTPWRWRPLTTRFERRLRKSLGKRLRQLRERWARLTAFGLRGGTQHG